MIIFDKFNKMEYEYNHKLSHIYRVGKGLADITESFALSSLCLTSKL
ncbi:hypothetical protein [Clostridium fungisolvens]|nr:hypothetical protein [Clostridium fungisolvens]